MQRETSSRQVRFCGEAAAFEWLRLSRIGRTVRRRGHGSGLVNRVPQFPLADAGPRRLARTHVNLPEIGTLQWFDGTDRSLEDSVESSKHDLSETAK